MIKTHFLITLLYLITSLDSITFNKNTFEYLQLHHIQPMAWNPTGDFYNDNFDVEIKNKFITFCNEKNWNPNLILLAWIMKHPSNVVPVLGTTNPLNIKELNILNEIKISTQDWFHIYTIFLNKNVP